jgi:hypothetical protein
MAGNEQRAELTRKTLAAIKNETPINEFDRIAKDVAVERLTSELNLNDTFEARILFNLIMWPIKENSIPADKFLQPLVN